MRITSKPMIGPKPRIKIHDSIGPLWSGRKHGFRLHSPPDLSEFRFAIAVDDRDYSLTLSRGELFELYDAMSQWVVELTRLDAVNAAHEKAVSV